MNLIEARNLHKKFGRIEALQGVSFTVLANEVFGYIGPNGSGKTTTIKILCELLRADKGEALLYNDVNKGGPLFNRGVILDRLGLYKRLTAWENLEFCTRLAGFKGEKSRRIISSLLQKVGLYERRNDLVKTYSKGMARRLSIIKAIIHDPNILILDEPFEGVDTRTHYDLINFLLSWVKEDKRCIFFTSHNMADVELLCDRVAIIKEGKIIESSSLNSLKYGELSNTVRLVLTQDLSFEYLQSKIGELGKVKSISDRVATVHIKEPQLSQKIVRLLLEEGIFLKSFSFGDSDLENIYLKKIGEEKSTTPDCRGGSL